MNTQEISTDFNHIWDEYRHRVEGKLNNLIQLESASAQTLVKSMRYSCLSGGKRFRAVLVYACGKLFNTPLENLDSAACAIELIHTYSLIHDDLPAMDNDDFRRGNPASHVAFGEAMAILTGDALNTLAYEVLADPSKNKLSAKQNMEIISVLARASGPQGMAGGQCLDIESQDKTLSIAELKKIHHKKTGALISAAMKISAIASNASEQQQNIIEKYSCALGLAYQIRDDCLDNLNHNLNKKGINYTSYLNKNEIEKKLNYLQEKAISAIQELDADTKFLESISHFVITRKS